MEDFNLNSESLPQENVVDVGSGDGGEPVETVAPKAEVSPDSLSLKDLNTYLGKNFKSKDEALASVKETYNFVGKRKEDIAREVQSTQASDKLAQELQEIKIDRFFDKNPDLAPFREAYQKVGGNPEAFFNAPEFKPIFEAAKGYAESQKLKSVLESNPRIVASQDKLSKASEQLKAGRLDEAESMVARAVLDSLQR